MTGTDGEIKREPYRENIQGVAFFGFDEDHSIKDVLRWLIDENGALFVHTALDALIFEERYGQDTEEPS